MVSVSMTVELNTFGVAVFLSEFDRRIFLFEIVSTVTVRSRVISHGSIFSTSESRTVVPLGSIMLIKKFT